MTAVATEQATALTTVVLGPKTRLGAALLARSVRPGRRTPSPATSEDQAALASSGATVIGAETSGPLLGDTRPPRSGSTSARSARSTRRPRSPARDAVLRRPRPRPSSRGCSTRPRVATSTSYWSPACWPWRPRPTGPTTPAGRTSSRRSSLRWSPSTPSARLSVLYPGRLMTADERRRPVAPHAHHFRAARRSHEPRRATVRGARASSGSTPAPGSWPAASRCWPPPSRVRAVLAGVMGSPARLKRLKGTQSDDEEARAGSPPVPAGSHRLGARGAGGRDRSSW